VPDVVGLGGAELAGGRDVVGLEVKLAAVLLKIGGETHGEQLRRTGVGLVARVPGQNGLAAASAAPSSAAASSAAASGHY
jgi:hypothetical protein